MRQSGDNTPELWWHSLRVAGDSVMRRNEDLDAEGQVVLFVEVKFEWTNAKRDSATSLRAPALKNGFKCAERSKPWKLGRK